MKAYCICSKRRSNPQAIMSLALSRYQFATPEIRLLMRQVLGHAVSGRTIKRLVRQQGRKLKRGRPATRPRIHKSDLRDLVELTASGLEFPHGNMLQMFQVVQVQFGLTPRQYIEWAKKQVRRGKCMIRRCLLCNEMFSSMESTDRHCRLCRGDRQRLVAKDRRSSFA